MLWKKSRDNGLSFAGSGHTTNRNCIYNQNIYVDWTIRWFRINVGENMKNNNRMTRINDEIRKELSEIFRTELKDPRIKAMTSVIRTETTTDLKFCKVFVSVLGNDEEKKSVMEGLKNGKGFIRHLIAERINLRITPELLFRLDNSVEYSLHMTQLIDQITKEDAKSHASGDGHGE